MTGAALRALRYLLTYRVQSLCLILVLSVMILLPVLLAASFGEIRTTLTRRVDTSPLILAGRGQGTQAFFAALYFADGDLRPITWADLHDARLARAGQVIPLLPGTRAAGYPLVGTGYGYMAARNLAFAQGRPFALLGEVVIGSQVARERRIGVGDTLMSDPDNAFDLAGSYPAELTVVGVLAPSLSPDDRAVFADIKTVWAIRGLGHGHQDLAIAADSNLILDARNGVVTANEALNVQPGSAGVDLARFHFHGDIATYPVAAALIVPDDARDTLVTQGRYLDAGTGPQIYDPAGILARLLEMMRFLQGLVNGALLAVNAGAGAAVVLVCVLIVRLRAREFESLRRLGVAEPHIRLQLALEFGTVAVCAAALSALLVMTGRSPAGNALLRLLIERV